MPELLVPADPAIDRKVTEPASAAGAGQAEHSAAGAHPPPLSPTSSNSLVSDTELEAALAEIELLCAGKPSDADNPSEALAELPDKDEADAELDAADETDDAAEAHPPQEQSPQPVEPGAKKIRFKIAKPESAAQASAAAAAAPPQAAPPARPPAPAAQPAPLQVPAAPVTKRIDRALDRLLDWLNRPFAWLPVKMRDVLGAAAIVTILMSIIMPSALQQFAPKTDPVSFLQQKRIEFERGPELAAEDAIAGSHDSHAGAADHGNGHASAGGHASGSGGSGHSAAKPKTGGGHH